MFIHCKNSSLNQHLVYIDLLQKYSYKDFNEINKIKEINILFDLANFNVTNSISEEILQIYSNFIIYSFGCILPNIMVSKILKLAVKNNKYFLKLILKNKKDITFFLDNIYFEIFSTNSHNTKIIKTETSYSLFKSINKTFYLNNLSTKIRLPLIITFKFNSKDMNKKKLFKKYTNFWCI